LRPDAAAAESSDTLRRDHAATVRPSLGLYNLALHPSDLDIFVCLAPPAIHGSGARSDGLRPKGGALNQIFLAALWS